MRIFRRSSSDKEQLAVPKVVPELDFPEIALAKDAVFTEQHDELDDLEERLATLQAPALPPINDGLINDGIVRDSIAPSAGRINEVDLRHVMSLDDDEQDADFERRFEAFANHSDARSSRWTG